MRKSEIKERETEREREQERGRERARMQGRVREESGCVCEGERDCVCYREMKQERASDQR